MNKPSWFHSGELTKEDFQKINELLAKATREAQEKTWAAGRPITIAEDGWIIKVWADGRKEKIQKIQS